ncbi:hypothetical protein AAHA92_15498 [Salvia divinorum]|uniref:Uncharacterized protein n=1 Tax=Salvia divinorum TaxID=28513 RepID=A0ABD1HIX9_SALDI
MDSKIKLWYTVFSPTKRVGLLILIKAHNLSTSLSSFESQRQQITASTLASSLFLSLGRLATTTSRLLRFLPEKFEDIFMIGA